MNAPSLHQRRILFLWHCIVFVFAMACGITIAHGQGREKQDTVGTVIALVGDTQRTGFWEALLLRKQNDRARALVAAEIAREHPSLLVHLGDVVDQGDSDESWEYFDSTYAAVRAGGTIVAAVPGNHDYFGNNRHAMANFFRRFPRAGNRTWGIVTHDSIGFVLLNSNLDELTTAEIAEQDQWYKETLAALDHDPGVLAIVVCCHHSPYTNSTVVGESDAMQAHAVPAFLACTKAMIFFSGHCHSYEHLLKGGKHFVVSGGGGGPRQELAVGQRHPDLYSGPSSRPFHFCRLVRRGSVLTVQVMMLENEDTREWKVGDQWEAGGKGVAQN